MKGFGSRVVRHAMAAIAAAALTSALTLASSVSAWAQTPSAPSADDTCTPGQIVDFCRDVPPGHGFLRGKTGFTTIDAPGAATETVLFDINNRGQIVGGYIDATEARHSFLLDDGVLTTFAVPG